MGTNQLCNAMQRDRPITGVTISEREVRIETWWDGFISIKTAVGKEIFAGNEYLKPVGGLSDHDQNYKPNRNNYIFFSREKWVGLLGESRKSLAYRLKVNGTIHGPLWIRVVLNSGGQIFLFLSCFVLLKVFLSFLSPLPNRPALATSNDANRCKQGKNDLPSPLHIPMIVMAVGCQF
jgi:hypothetical protein